MYTLWQQFDGFHRFMLVLLVLSVVLLVICIVDSRRWACRLRESEPPLPYPAVRKLVAYRIVASLSSPVMVFLLALSNLLGDTVSVWWKLLCLVAMVCAGRAPTVSARVLGVKSERIPLLLKGPGWQAVGIGLYVVLLSILVVFAILATVVVASGSRAGGLVVLAITIVGVLICLRNIWHSLTIKEKPPEDRLGPLAA